MSEGEQVPVMPPAPERKPIFVARPGFSTDFSDITAPAEPTLGIDEALGVRWLRLRGRLVGVRYGTLRQRRAMEKQLEAVSAEGSEDEQYEAGIAVFQPLLCLPDATNAEGVRMMTVAEIEERLDLVDLQPLAQLAFPAVSPVRALIDAGANPN
jgi:hypothetical protein